MGNANRDNFGILMYHRVTPRVVGVAPPTWNVPPDRFRQQLAGLLSRGYQAWPLQRVLRHRAAGETLPARTFVVTFDDGYDNVYQHAWPILKELRIPATIFVATAYLDSPAPFPFDDWSAAGAPTVPRVAWQPMSTAHCREMLDEGLIELGSHTHSHTEFLGRPEAFQIDLTQSLDKLQNTFGCREAAFAFPYGRYSDELVDVVRQAGVACALTTEPTMASASVDPLRWGRFTVLARDTSWTLTLKLTAWYTSARSAWRWLGWWRKRNRNRQENAAHVERRRSDRSRKPSGANPLL